jgi:hypothetical protein
MGTFLDPIVTPYRRGDHYHDHDDQIAIRADSAHLDPDDAGEAIEWFTRENLTIARSAAAHGPLAQVEAEPE